MTIAQQAVVLFIFIFLQIAYGAFVSGTHSGLLFNTWPMYNGNIFPLIENKMIESFKVRADEILD